MKFVLRESKIKRRVTIYTDPSYIGADIDDSLRQELPVIEFDSSKNELTGLEPEDKLQSAHSKATIKKMVIALKNGKSLPPMMIYKIADGYEILDGHHRNAAYKIAGIKRFPVQVVPAREIKTSTETPDEG
jgi:hypothetical protein